MTVIGVINVSAVLMSHITNGKVVISMHGGIAVGRVVVAIVYVRWVTGVDASKVTGKTVTETKSHEITSQRNFIQTV